jgi:hypothetical protein
MLTLLALQRPPCPPFCDPPPGDNEHSLVALGVMLAILAGAWIWKRLRP